MTGPSIAVIPGDGIDKEVCLWGVLAVEQEASLRGVTVELSESVPT